MAYKTQNSAPTSGLILEIQRMSTEDGPGLRTTVFFKGCSLECAWCHNPESIHPYAEIQWIDSRCIGCRTCIDVCPENALSLMPDGMHINRDICTRCGVCTEECPSTAMEMLGQTWQLDDLVHEVLKDRVYFQKSGGGVTVSGGEPTLQGAFTAAFLERIKAEGISTALDTCGLCSRRHLEMILPQTDQVLFDLKTIDARLHQQLTGRTNQKILDNLVHIAEWLKRHGSPHSLWIRTPIIPGATDTAANITAIGKWIAAHVNRLTARWELCAFNNLCRDKYTRLGIVWPFRHTELLKQHQMMQLFETAKASGLDPDIIRWSGPTKLEDPPQQSTELRVVTA
jgi:pyruvate formate lyase activating enzyme